MPRGKKIDHSLDGVPSGWHEGDMTPPEGYEDTYTQTAVPQGPELRTDSGQSLTQGKDNIINDDRK